MRKGLASIAAVALVALFWALDAPESTETALTQHAPHAVAGDQRLASSAVTPGVPTSGETLAKEEEEEEEKDYWLAIPFDRRNFEEVRSYVREKYIEGLIEEGRAYAESANFALASNEDRPFILLPRDFYEARKDHPDEEGRLKGKLNELAPSDPFVILDTVDDKDEPRKRLSDKEIRELRDKDKARTMELDAAWKRARFVSRDFDRVMAFLSRTHTKPGKWSMKTAWVAAANGYLYSLDPHSALIPAEAWKDSTQELTDASFEGIGAILTRRHDSDYTIVESPIDGQPAVKAGLTAGDVIVAVDGKSIKDMLLPKVVSRIKGPKGTEVVLTVQREGEPKDLEIRIVRSRIEIKNIQGRLLTEHANIGYVKITGFVPTTNLELGRMVRRLEREAPGSKLEGLILDLRRNSGGLLKQGIKVADRFLREGSIVTVKSRGEPDEIHEATSHGTWDVPLVVLVDDGSASASEIVASALQDGGRALVVGDRTFGKASVQTLFSPMLRDDYYIKLTVARYYSPSGRTLQVVGVQPDVIVPPEADKAMPLGFREENLSHHLMGLNPTYRSTNASWSRAMEACANKEGNAKSLREKNPRPAVRYDYQIHRSADLLACMKTQRWTRSTRRP